MSGRIKLAGADPKAYEAMLGLEKYLNNSGLDKILFELIKTRASQINGCAYCINMHVNDAIKIGESTQRLFLLDAWRETNLFTEKERAVLELTEYMTLISRNGVPDHIYTEVKKHLSDQELAAVIMAIVAINGWNRISIALNTPID